VAMQRILCILVVLALVSYLTTGSTQKYIVKGRFVCGSKASPGNETSVKLISNNVGLDDNMGKVKANADGSFRIDGTASKLLTIHPEIHIYTDCNDGLPGQRRWKVKLPKKYIDDAHGYDIGVFNLESELVGEDRDLWH